MITEEQIKLLYDSTIGLTDEQCRRLTSFMTGYLLSPSKNLTHDDVRQAFFDRMQTLREQGGN